MITDKSRKTTFVQFDTLEQLRQSIFSRIKQTVKKDPDVVENVAGYISRAKTQAESDLDKWDQQVSVIANKTKKSKGKKTKKKKSKKGKKGKKGKKSRKESSSSSSSSSTSTPSPSPSPSEKEEGSSSSSEEDGEKSAKSEMKRKGPLETSEGVQSTLDKYKKRKKSKSEKENKDDKISQSGSKEDTEKEVQSQVPPLEYDDDLWQNPRFSPKGSDAAGVSEELQELLHPPLERFMKLDTEAWCLLQIKSYCWAWGVKGFNHLKGGSPGLKWRNLDTYGSFAM